MTTPDQTHPQRKEVILLPQELAVRKEARRLCNALDSSDLFAALEAAKFCSSQAAKDAKFRQQLGELGVLEHLLSFLDRCTSDLARESPNSPRLQGLWDCQTTALRALSNFICDSRQNQLRLKAHPKGLVWIIPLMQNFADPQLQRIATMAVTNMASGAPDMQEILVRDGIIPPLVKLIFHYDESVHGTAIRTLEIFCQSPSTASVAIKAGALEGLIELLTMPDKKHQIQKDALHVINLLVREKSALHVAAEAGLFECLVAVITRKTRVAVAKNGLRDVDVYGDNKDYDDVDSVYVIAADLLAALSSDPIVWPMFEDKLIIQCLHRLEALVTFQLQKEQALFHETKSELGDTTHLETLSNSGVENSQSELSDHPKPGTAFSSSDSVYSSSEVRLSSYSFITQPFYMTKVDSLLLEMLENLAAGSPQAQCILFSHLLIVASVVINASSALSDANTQSCSVRATKIIRIVATRTDRAEIMVQRQEADIMFLKALAVRPISSPLKVGIIRALQVLGSPKINKVVMASHGVARTMVSILSSEGEQDISIAKNALGVLRMLLTEDVHFISFEEESCYGSSTRVVASLSDCEAIPVISLYARGDATNSTANLQLEAARILARLCVWSYAKLCLSPTQPHQATRIQSMPASTNKAAPVETPLHNSVPEQLDVSPHKGPEVFTPVAQRYPRSRLGQEMASSSHSYGESVSGQQFSLDDSDSGSSEDTSLSSFNLASHVSYGSFNFGPEPAPSSTDMCSDIVDVLLAQGVIRCMMFLLCQNSQAYPMYVCEGATALGCLTRFIFSNRSSVAAHTRMSTVASVSTDLVQSLTKVGLGMAPPFAKAEVFGTLTLLAQYDPSSSLALKQGEKELQALAQHCRCHNPQAPKDLLSTLRELHNHFSTTYSTLASQGAGGYSPSKGSESTVYNSKFSP